MKRQTKTRWWGVALVLAVAACDGDAVDGKPTGEAALMPGKSDSAHLGAAPDEAGKAILYEVQVRTANACRVDLGSESQRAACAAKVAPPPLYRAEGMSCDQMDTLGAVRLGTLDDLLEDTADFRSGVTLRYIAERVAANTVWLMPLFPNNDTWSIPAACDNLGSPYAVRDYLHAAASHARACIIAERDESGAEPCWGNDALEAVIAGAHARGLKVMLDIALNHFGHNYMFYDVAAHKPVRDRIAARQDLDKLWDFGKTYESALLHPEILDTPAELEALVASDSNAKKALDGLRERCPSLEGMPLVRSFGMWREALDWERAAFPCDDAFLEAALPGFYLGQNHFDPAARFGDFFTNDWPDVKFLFHHADNEAHQHEFVRDREYLFRILNYWVARGVDGFRLDHTTDYYGGMGPSEWRYILGKVVYYAERRGQARPMFLAEEFHDQQGMADVVDVLTEGYVRDMTGRDGATKDASYVERLVANMARFGDRAYVMTALETHDERRLIDGTGFDRWTGAGFWGIGATTWSTPMMLMGQEFGESAQLGFRRSDLLPARFEGSASQPADADALVDFYGKLNRARRDTRNRALLSNHYAFLRARDTLLADPRLFAEVKWSDDGNVVFAFHNLWKQAAAQSYFIAPEVAAALSLNDALRYRLVDVFTDTQVGKCQTGAELKWDLYVSMDAETRLQWLRLELCL